jgi:hypothetical protein
MSPLLVSCLLFQSPLPTHRVTAEFRDVEVREVIKYIMRTAPNQAYTLDNGITGQISQKFVDVPFLEAVNRVARAGSVTYTIEDGVFIFNQITNPTPKPTHKVSGITVGSDPTLYSRIISSDQTTTQASLDTKVKELRAKSEPAYKVLRRALDAVGVNYVVSDALKNPISISVKNVPLREVLDSIMSLSNGQYTELPNIVLITQIQ